MTPSYRICVYSTNCTEGELASKYFTSLLESPYVKVSRSLSSGSSFEVSINTTKGPIFVEFHNDRLSSDNATHVIVGSKDYERIGTFVNLLYMQQRPPIMGVDTHIVVVVDDLYPPPYNIGRLHITSRTFNHDTILLSIARKILQDETVGLEPFTNTTSTDKIDKIILLLEKILSK